ncbi:uncharacterized protein LOC125028222 [Penaeus chinensis]|uniref:uncharacterized protein LOC125028222 n=1 Tax=Penaeus chinensis TaxID=139456 RepID=UPI001FB76264|nr:uncharacterized protein LOC125028222 [Penaeus chinensis]
MWYRVVVANEKLQNAVSTISSSPVSLLACAAIATLENRDFYCYRNQMCHLYDIEVAGLHEDSGAVSVCMTRIPPGTEIPTTTTTAETITPLPTSSSVPALTSIESPSAGQSTDTQVNSSSTPDNRGSSNYMTEFFISNATTSNASFASQEVLCRNEGGQAARSLSMAQIDYFSADDRWRVWTTLVGKVCWETEWTLEWADGSRFNHTDDRYSLLNFPVTDEGQEEVCFAFRPGYREFVARPCILSWGLRVMCAPITKLFPSDATTTNGSLSSQKSVCRAEEGKALFHMTQRDVEGLGYHYGSVTAWTTLSGTFGWDFEWILSWADGLSPETGLPVDLPSSGQYFGNQECFIVENSDRFVTNPCQAQVPQRVMCVLPNLFLSKATTINATYDNQLTVCLAEGGRPPTALTDTEVQELFDQYGTKTAWITLVASKNSSTLIWENRWPDGDLLDPSVLSLPVYQNFFVEENQCFAIKTSSELRTRSCTNYHYLRVVCHWQ